MRNILTAILLLNGHVFGGEWVVTKGGLSPDKKLAVAVFPQKTESIDEADDSVILIDQTTRRRIGPLEEVSSSGGTWGSTTTNVHCMWSPDSTILIVNYRTGRLMNSSQIYRIRDRRAIPLLLPDAKTHPKGKLLVGLQSTANPGSEITLTRMAPFEREVGVTFPTSVWTIRSMAWPDLRESFYSIIVLTGRDSSSFTTLLFHQHHEQPPSTPKTEQSLQPRALLDRG